MLFLDLDGCLVDSAPAILTCLDEAFRAFQEPPLGAGEAEGVIGPPIGVSVARILANRSVRHISAGQLVSRFREIYAVRAPTLTPAQPSILEALEELADRDKLVVVTSKAQVLAEPIVTASGIGKYLEGVFGPDIDDIDEPKHVTLRRAIATVGMTSGIVIGDREHDVYAAHRENLPAIGVTWGSGSLAELQAARADAIVESPSHLYEAVARLRSSVS